MIDYTRLLQVVAASFLQLVASASLLGRSSKHFTVSAKRVVLLRCFRLLAFLSPLRDAFRHCSGKDHIKVKELRALIRLVQKVASWGCRRKRILTGLGSSFDA